MLTSSTPSSSVGHSPVGGWSTVLMLALVAVQAVTGLFISDDIFYAGPYNSTISGDLAGFLARVHHINFSVLQIAVAVHLLAVGWYALRKRQNLVAPMLLGRRPLGPAEAGEAIEDSRLLRGIVLAALAAGAVTLLVQAAPPPSMDVYF